MIDVGKDLQNAYDDGYRQGVKDTLDDIHKTLERSLREKASHLTEPNNRKTENSSEKTNNCDTCRFELYCPEMCEGCCEWDSHYEPKDEPTISKMEQVDEPTGYNLSPVEDESQTADVCTWDGKVGEIEIHNILYEPTYNEDDGSM